MTHEYPQDRKIADQELPKISYSRELLVHNLASKMVSWGLALAEDHHESFAEEEEYEHLKNTEWAELLRDAINEAFSWIPENPGRANGITDEQIEAIKAQQEHMIDLDEEVSE